MKTNVIAKKKTNYLEAAELFEQTSFSTPGLTSAFTKVEQLEARVSRSILFTLIWNKIYVSDD